MLYNASSMGRQPQNCRFPIWRSRPHLIGLHGSFGLCESAPKRHLDRFSVNQQTDTQTDHATPSVAIACIQCGLKQGDALTGRNTTGPPLAAHWWVTLRRGVLQTTDDRRQRPLLVCDVVKRKADRPAAVLVSGWRRAWVPRVCRCSAARRRAQRTGCSVVCRCSRLAGCRPWAAADIATWPPQTTLPPWRRPARHHQRPVWTNSSPATRCVAPPTVLRCDDLFNTLWRVAFHR